jgi:hypothetical protein
MHAVVTAPAVRVSYAGGARIDLLAIFLHPP